MEAVASEQGSSSSSSHHLVTFYQVLPGATRHWAKCVTCSALFVTLIEWTGIIIPIAKKRKLRHGVQGEGWSNVTGCIGKVEVI